VPTLRQPLPCARRVNAGSVRGLAGWLASVCCTARAATGTGQDRSGQVRTGQDEDADETAASIQHQAETSRLQAPQPAASGNAGPVLPADWLLWRARRTCLHASSMHARPYAELHPHAVKLANSHIKATRSAMCCLPCLTPPDLPTARCLPPRLPLMHPSPYSLRPRSALLPWPCPSPMGPATGCANCAFTSNALRRRGVPANG